MVLLCAGMQKVDKKLDALVEYADFIVILQYRLMQDHVEFLTLRVGLSFDAAFATDQLQCRCSEEGMWRGRDVVWTSSEALALAWLRGVYLNGLREGGDHSHPILVPCNYSGVAVRLVLWLRSEATILLKSKGVPEEEITRRVNHVQLYNADTNARDGQVGRGPCTDDLLLSVKARCMPRRV